MADEYPESGLTDNLELSLEGMAVNLADNFITLDKAFPAGVVQLQYTRVPYTLTANDVLKGYCTIPVVWSKPWKDTAYAVLFGIESPVVVGVADFAVGAVHNKTIAGCDAVVNLTPAILLVDGELDCVNTNAAQTLAFPVPAATTLQNFLYNCTFYMQCLGDGGASDTMDLQIIWIDPQGNTQTEQYTMLTGNALSVAQFSFPVFAKVGTTVTINTVWTGTGGHFHYNMALRIVNMPQNSIAYNVGDKMTLDAMSLHS